MPTRFNGAGLLVVDGVIPAAFVGSVIACCEVDSVIATHASDLERFAEPALRLLLTRLAPLGNERANEVLLLPLAAPMDLFSLPATWSQTRTTNELPRRSVCGGG